jgi:neutral ceramidase
LKKLLAALLLLAAFSAVALVRWRPERAAEPPRLERVARGEGLLSAGAAEVPLDLPGTVPVGGFPRWRWASQGVRDRVSVRALALGEPGCLVVLASVEILVVPGDLSRAVASRVKDLALDGLLVAATHTHAGPGGYWNHALAERVATGPYDARIFEALADRVAEAVRRAVAARKPALLSATRTELSDLSRNRNGTELDGRLLALRLSTAAGEPLAQVLVFPAHATLLGRENRRLSGDWPGSLSRAQAATTLFFQGAMGDQSVRLPGGAPGATPETYATALGARLAQLSFSRGDPRPPLSVATAVTLLPDVQLGAVPRPLRRAATNLLGSRLPSRGQVTVLRLGPVLLLAVPAEPSAAVGRQWRSALGEEAEVLSLAGDYLGYAETRERVQAGQGEVGRTYYGPDLAVRLERALEAAAAAAQGAPSTGAR